MAGPGIRYLNFARELRDEGDVTLVVPFETDLEPDGFELVVADSGTAPRSTALTAGADCVVAQRLPVPTMRTLARTRTRRIYDLYAPLHIENLALDARQGAERQPREAAGAEPAHADAVVLRTGDAFICASETQRDLWLGALLQLGRVDHERYAARPVAARADRRRPVRHRRRSRRAHDGRVLKGVVPGIGEDDRVLLWPGGIWNWFDPLTVIDAVAELARRRDDVRLVLPRPAPSEPARARDADGGGAPSRARTSSGCATASSSSTRAGCRTSERGAYLLEADVGVSAHFDDLESRFAFRTRLLDCFWAGLPVVTTGATRSATSSSGAVSAAASPPATSRGWVAALEALLDDARRVRRARAARSRAVREEFLWPRVVEPLRRLVREPGRPVARRHDACGCASWIALARAARSRRPRRRRRSARARRSSRPGAC